MILLIKSLVKVIQSLWVALLPLLSPRKELSQVGIIAVETYSTFKRVKAARLVH